MKEPEVIQRFPEPGTTSDENDKSKLFNKDHNYFSVDEKCAVLMTGSLAKTKDESSNSDRNTPDSSVSDVFRNGKKYLLFPSENQNDSLLPVDITKEMPRTNRTRLETRFRTNSSDSAFSEDSLIDFETDEDAKLESIINQFIFNTDDLQTDLSSYVKSDNNATCNDIDSFDVNDLFCSDVICEESQSAAVHSSDLVNTEKMSKCNGSHVKQQSRCLLIKPDCSFPTVEISKYPKLEKRQSTSYTGPSFQLTDSSNVATSHTKGDHVGLASVSATNTDILEMAFSHKSESLRKETTILSPTVLQNVNNYENPSEYCVIDIDGNVHKDNAEIISDDAQSSPGADEQKDDLMKIKMDSSVTDSSLNGNVLEFDQSIRKCHSHASSEVTADPGVDVTVRNDIESDSLKGDNPLLQPLCFFDALDSYDDVKKSYKANEEMVFNHVFESESGRLERNHLKTASGSLAFHKHFETKPDFSENTLSYLTEEFVMDNLNGRKLNAYLSGEKHSNLCESITNKGHLKSVLKDLFLDEEYFEQNKRTPHSPTEQKEPVEDFNTKLLRSLDVLAILSPQSQGSNDMEMLPEPTDNGIQFKNIELNSSVTSSQKHFSKKRSVHNINFLTQSPQAEESCQENAGAKIDNESKMTDDCIGNACSCNTGGDFERRSTVPNVLSFKDLSEQVESKFTSSFKAISSDDSDSKQIKVPRLSLNRKHSVDSNLIEDSLLRKVLTGKLSSPTSFFTNGRCVKEKNYQTIRFSKSIDLSNCPIVNKTFSGFTNKFPRDHNVGMSELEKYLRGLIPTVGSNETVSQETNTDLDGRFICQKYSGRSFLKRLLTGEINSDMYYKMDARLCRQERFTQLVKKMSKRKPMKKILTDLGKNI